jgi:hypothetical protein
MLAAITAGNPAYKRLTKTSGLNAIDDDDDDSMDKMNGVAPSAGFTERFWISCWSCFFFA